MIFLCKGIRYSSGSAQRCFFGIPTAHVIFLTIVDKVGDYVLDLLVIHQSAQKYLRAQTLRHCQPLIEASAAAAAAKSLQSCLTLCRPHRRQPTRLPRPWDSPGKNTGVSCHFLLQCMKVKSESEVTQSCPTLCDPMDCSLPGSSVHGILQVRVLEWDAIAFSDRRSK